MSATAKRVPLDEAEVTSWIQSTVPCLLLDLIRIAVGYAQWIDTRIQAVADDRTDLVCGYLPGPNGTVFRAVRDSAQRQYLDQLDLRTMAVVRAGPYSPTVDRFLIAPINDHEMYAAVEENDKDFVYHYNLRTGARSMIYKVSDDPHFPRDGWLSHVFVHQAQLVLVVSRGTRPGYQVCVLTPKMDGTSTVDKRQSMRGLYLLAYASTPHGIVFADDGSDGEGRLWVLDEWGLVIGSTQLRGCDRLSLQHFKDNVVLGIRDEDQSGGRLELFSFNTTTGRIQRQCVVESPEQSYYDSFGFRLANTLDNGLCPNTAFIDSHTRLYSFRLPELDA